MENKGEVYTLAFHGKESADAFSRQLTSAGLYTSLEQIKLAYRESENTYIITLNVEEYRHYLQLSSSGSGHSAAALSGQYGLFKQEALEKFILQDNPVSSAPKPTS